MQWTVMVLLLLLQHNHPLLAWLLSQILGHACYKGDDRDGHVSATYKLLIVCSTVLPSWWGRAVTATTHIHKAANSGTAS